MREFFSGWRRKVGVVTLVMACVLMGAWIRSLFILDEITVHGSRSKKTVVSMDGFLTWSRFAPDGTEDWVVWTHKVISPKLRQERRRHGTYGWKWECCGFLFGAITKEITWWSRGLTFTSTEDYWQAPYWAATIPVTLISAYLLLWKPHRLSKPIDGPQDA